MENNEFKKVCIKNHTCYYSDDIIKLEDFDHDKILKDEKSHENIFIYKALLIQNLCALVFKIDGFITIYDGTRYLTLLGSEKYDAIYNRIKYRENQNWFLWFFVFRKRLTLHWLCECYNTY